MTVMPLKPTKLPINYCSTAVFYFLLGTFLISWHKKKQDIVAYSSIEANYRAFASTTTELV